jgi:hypothetical protein
MFAGLSLDQAPPYKEPIKFFITAPIFAIIGGIFALFSKELIPHDPYLIATLHLITIGFIVMIIIGALQQMLPVIAGAVIPKAKITSNITYYSLSIGLIFFVLSFIYYQKIFFFLSASCLLFGLLYFSVVALYQLFKVKNKSYIVIGIIISLLFFISSFLLGIHLLIANATSNLSVLHYNFAFLHYNYVFFGFIFILIVSITLQVVPMFWVASSYKINHQIFMIFIPTVLLIIYPFYLFLELNLDFIYKIIMSLIIIFFVFTTIDKLQKRKRKLKDITVYFYTTSMVFLFIGIIYWILMDFFDLPVTILVILFGFGFVISLMNGMLYKIVPFLTWFHLNAQGVFEIPTMRDMIPITKMQTQYFLHLGCVILFIIGFGLEINFIIKLAVLLFIISNVLFFINIYKVVQIYNINNEKKGKI